MNVLPFFAPSFERYLTLERVHPTRTYNYAKRGVFGLPVIELTQHGPKCKLGESWLYMAVPVNARIDGISKEDRLYVGAQTQDRMFRGDGVDSANYHHAEMREGNGSDNPVTHLRAGKGIDIYRIPAEKIAATVNGTPDLVGLVPLLNQPKTPRKHIGYWFEQYILYAEPGIWRWNTAIADKSIARILSSPHA